MRIRWTCWLTAVLLMAACSHSTLTKVVRSDGTAVVGELIDARPDVVIVKTADGATVTIPRASISSIQAATSAEVASNLGSRDAATSNGANTSGGITAKSANNANAGANTHANAGGSGGSNAGSGSGGNVSAGANALSPVVLPAGTVLEVTLNSTIGSDTSRVGENVEAALVSPASLAGVSATSCRVVGSITEATRGDDAKGRGRLAVRFETLRVPKHADVPIAATLQWQAPAAAQREPPQRGGMWHRLIGKTKRGLGMDQSARGNANVHVAQGATLRLKLEQPASISMQ